MKTPKLSVLISVGLGLALALSVILGFRMWDKASVRFGRSQEANAVLKVDKAALAKEKAALVGVIAEKDVLIAEQATAIGQMTSTIGQAQASEAAAHAESDKLKAEVQPVIDANPKLKAFVFSLESRLTQKDGIIAGQAAIILNLGVPTLIGYENGVKVFSYPEGSVTHSLNAQRIVEHTIAAGFEKQLRQTEAVLAIEQSLTKALVGKVRKAQIIGNIKTTAILAATAILGLKFAKVI